MSDAVFEIGHTFRIGIPGCDIVVASLSIRTVKRRKVVLGNIAIISPASQLIAIVECNGDLDVYRHGTSVG